MGGQPRLAVVSSTADVADTAAVGAARRRRKYRYHRRHKPHFYLGSTSLALAVLLCITDLGAWLNGTSTGQELAFAVLCGTLVMVLATYFLGFFMVMDGNIPLHRIKVFLPHALVGSLSPLLYMLNFSIAFDTLGRRPIHPLSLALAAFSAALIGIQYLMGRRVTHVEGLRLVPVEAAHDSCPEAIPEKRVK